MKDNQIQNLFDNYADELQPQPQLAEKARSQMPTSRPVKRVMWLSFAALCCVVLLVVAVRPMFLPEDGSDVVSPGDHASSTVISYTSAQVSGKQVDAAAVSDFLSLAGLEQSSDYQVVYQRYYAYYFNDSQSLAYVNAFLGVSTENGIVELKIVAESENYVRDDLYVTYVNRIQGQSGVQSVEKFTAERGEYVSQLFFNAHGMHFYVQAQTNPQNQQNIEKIIDFLS